MTSRNVKPTNAHLGLLLRQANFKDTSSITENTIVRYRTIKIKISMKILFFISF